MEKSKKEIEEERKIETRKHAVELWKKCSSPEEFFLALAVEAPDLPKLDMFFLKRHVFMENHPWLGWILMPAALAVSCMAIGFGFSFSLLAGLVFVVLQTVLWTAFVCLSCWWEAELSVAGKP